MNPFSLCTRNIFDDSTTLVASVGAIISLNVQISISSSLVNNGHIVKHERHIKSSVLYDALDADIQYAVLTIWNQSVLGIISMTRMNREFCLIYLKFFFIKIQNRIKLNFSIFTLNDKSCMRISLSFSKDNKKLTDSLKKISKETLTSERNCYTQFHLITSPEGRYFVFAKFLLLLFPNKQGFVSFLYFGSNWLETWWALTWVQYAKSFFKGQTKKIVYFGMLFLKSWSIKTKHCVQTPFHKPHT